jgi:hypothetical protein
MPLIEAKPDRVFSAILDSALEDKASLVREHLELRGDGAREWADSFPELLPWFDARFARATLDQLSTAHLPIGPYEIGTIDFDLMVDMFCRGGPPQ